MVDFLFVVSSEAGHKVGGIYTVLTTMSGELVKNFGENLIFVGMYDPNSARVELKSEEPPKSFAAIFSDLKQHGINCHFGRWVNGNNAKVVLVEAWDFGSRKAQKDSGESDTQVNVIKYNLWKNHHIDSLLMGQDFTENVTWATAVGVLIEKLLKTPELHGKKPIAHFHEWIAGAGLLYLKDMRARVATAFTTHATALGRSKGAAGQNLMKEIEEKLSKGKTVDVQEAYKYHVEGKHLIEVACARESDVFTTVSDTVARECEYILGKKPDLVTPNAMNLSKMKTPSKLLKEHKENRHDIFEVLEAMFLPYYDPRAKDSLIAFTSGRYEFENKGIDYFVYALGELNKRMKKEKTNRQLYALICVPSNIKGPREELLENSRLIERMLEIIREETKHEIDIADSFEETKLKLTPEKQIELDELRKSLRKFGPLPPNCAFELSYESDVILSAMATAGLANTAEDPVKVVFYPSYLRAGDGVLNMTYEEVMNGSDVGVFPSRYEPWGYTPMEAAALLSVAITTECAGFGAFITKLYGDTSKRGVKVVETKGKSDQQVVEQITDALESLTKLTPTQLAKLKEDARKMIDICDWKDQIKKYSKAYDIAERRAKL